MMRFSTVCSLLAGRAIEGAAVSQRDSFDRAWADPALFPVAIVDSKMILELAKLIVGVAIVGKRGAAPADRFTQDPRNHGRNPFHLFSCQPRRSRHRPDARAAKDFVRVDIPDTRDHLLVQEEIPNSST